MITGRNPSSPDLLPPPAADFRREIEIFSSGCEACEAAVAQVGRLARRAGEIIIRRLGEPGTQERARLLGLTQFPAVVLDGEIVTAAGTCLHAGE